MMPLIDTMMAPGTAAAMIVVGPAVAGVALALAAAVAWMARATAEQLRRTAAREWERRTLDVAPPAREPRTGVIAA